MCFHASKPEVNAEVLVTCCYQKLTSRYLCTTSRGSLYEVCRYFSNLTAASPTTRELSRRVDGISVALVGHLVRALLYYRMGMPYDHVETFVLREIALPITKTSSERCPAIYTSLCYARRGEAYARCGGCRCSLGIDCSSGDVL
jgi:hypothetical protein